MVRVVDEGLFPQPRAALWKFLDLHLQDESIHAIHPAVLDQRTLRTDGEEVRLTRTLQARGRAKAVGWKITAHRPDWQKWEIVEAPEGPMAVGSYLLNRYTEVPGGTQVASEADITLTGIPRLFQRRILRRVFDDLDREDLAYLAAHPIE